MPILLRGQSGERWTRTIGVSYVTNLESVLIASRVTSPKFYSAFRIFRLSFRTTPGALIFLGDPASLLYLSFVNANFSAFVISLLPFSCFNNVADRV